DGHWFSQYPIGSPAFIALGVLGGIAWLVNPLLLAIAISSLYRFLALVFDELTARVATVLFVSSPMVLIMAASQMNHVPTLALTMLALAGLAQWDASRDELAQQRQGLLVGLALGLAATVRPLDAAVIGAGIGCFQVWRALHAPERWRSLIIEVAACAIPIVL